MDKANWLPLISAVIVLGLGYLIQKQLFRSGLRKELRYEKLSLLRQSVVELMGLLGQVTDQFLGLEKSYQVASKKAVERAVEKERLELLDDDKLRHHLDIELEDLSGAGRHAAETFCRLQERRNMIDLLLSPGHPGKAGLLSEIDGAIELTCKADIPERSKNIGEAIGRIRDMARTVLDAAEKKYLESL